METILHKFYDANTQGRDFVLGDLHGCYDKLMHEMKLVSFDKKKDRIFSVGDLIDRGPDSVKCLELIREPWFNATMGNHEDFMFKAVLDYENAMLWYQNGGDWFANIEEGSLTTLILYARKNMPLAITIGEGDSRVGICHAGPNKFMDWEHSISPHFCDMTDLFYSSLWSRSYLRDGPYETVKNVGKLFCGHTVMMNGPVKRINVNYIDTGVVFNGKLTMLEL